MGWKGSGAPCVDARAPHYDDRVSLQPPSTDDWVALTETMLGIEAAGDWVALPGCGAVVIFSGLVRDHAEGTDGVTHIEYEAWAEQIEPRLLDIVAEARRRWPDIGRMVLWHRHGDVALSESSVVVAVSTPHRASAFEAAQFGIDTLKATVPIWKKEFSADGSQWAQSAQHIVDAPKSRASSGQVS
ncbi:MoaE Molybdopterin converting factor, large subunit [Acidimicrobiia bacterium]